MIPAHDLLLFAFTALMLVLRPLGGPNMIYLISRSIVQGKQAGMVSLLGVMLGFLVPMTLATFGLTAVFLAIPYAHEVVKLIGAAYLLWMACNTIRARQRFTV